MSISLRRTKHSVRSTAASISPFAKHPSRAERLAHGKRLRDACPRRSHATWEPPASRLDAVTVVLKAEKGREPELLPLRHGRMVESPFAFYRGSALAMALDLARTPSTGVRVQCCGDAHLSNFGGFATPERRVIFSINDLDETLPASWEWDVKRLAASFVVACRANGFREADGRHAVLECMRSYRNSMGEFSQMKTLELWHFVIDIDTMISSIKDPGARARAIKRLAKESGRSQAEDLFPKLAASSDESYFIKDQLPAIFHWKDHRPGEIAKAVETAFVGYRESLLPVTRLLLDRFEIKDAAIKVVGVGSVGTRCWVLLLMAAENDPFFLQVKEARASVLEAFAGKSVFANHGERVVNGYRIMQPYSDSFLGWTIGETGRHYFIRQLRDIKISAAVELYDATTMALYAKWCGRALALAHARGGDAAVLSGYMGKSDVFDKALVRFSVAYADQNEKDHAALAHAVRAGKIEAVVEKDR